VYPASDLTSIVRRAARPARVVLAVTDQTHGAIYDQLTSLTQSGVEVAAMTSVYEEVTGRIPIHNLGSSWWTVLPRPSTDLGYRTAKYLLDVIGVVAGLTLLAVVLPVIGPLLMRETHGSLFFTQTRIGRLGKPFKLIKLRTLAATEHAHKSLWDRKTANRASRLGSLIRATGIDELPQCLNVLKAEMSLVGPRPYVTEEVADFQR
jgi:lipopolysaccharide/colanic/teichoic acid biosynthesis glycosyltransferase